MLSARTLRDFARSSLDTVANERLGKIQKAAIQGFVRTQRHSRLAAAATAADVDTPPVLSPAQVRYNLMPPQSLLVGQVGCQPGSVPDTVTREVLV
jgi:hypothetical protein